MKRRLLLAGLAPAALAAGCGFQLRRAPDFAFDAITIHAPVSSPVAHELAHAIGANSDVQVLRAAATAPAPVASAPAGPPRVVFDLLLEQREKVVVGLNASGQVREFQLRSRLRFRVRTPQGTELIPETELLQMRDMSFNEAAVLAKESEEALLYRDMEAELVRQLMRRLASLRAV